MKIIRAFMTSLLVFSGLSANGVAAAPLTTYSDKTTFLSDTGATIATTPYNDTGFNTFSGLFNSFISGSVTFGAASALGTLYFGDASTRLAGGEITISDFEHLNVQLAQPAFALGFDFVEPQSDPLVNAPFVDSTFTVTLFSGATNVGSFTFNALNDQAAFVGVWSPVSFTDVQIRETTGGIENEFYGQFYTGATAPASVPAPATIWLLISGLPFMLLRQRRLSN
jgi:hypothetical protein